MYAAERQQEILRVARQAGRVDVAALVHAFGVTGETIRRDLTQLERQGLLRRVHGGALPVERLRIEPGVTERADVMAAEKERIARAALAYLPREGVVILDAGTTTARLGDVFPDGRELTVVTNALPIAMTLSTRPQLTVLTVGGRVRGRTLAQVDQWALRTLDEISVDIAFIATNGLSIERGLTTPDLAEAAAKAAMIDAAERVVLLADHTKVGNDQFVRFARVDQVDVFITDTGLDEGTVADFEAVGVEVVRA